MAIGSIFDKDRTTPSLRQAETGQQNQAACVRIPDIAVSVYFGMTKEWG